MYLISEFSKITTIPVKTLHYYDQEKLLVPYKRAPDTGYRFYNEENYQAALRLLFLRELDFSIKEIKAILASPLTEEAFKEILFEKKEQLKSDMLKKKQLIKRIDQELSPSSKERLPLGKVGIRSLPATTIISKTFTGHYRDVGKYIGQLYRSAGRYSKGAPFTRHFEDYYQEEGQRQLCLALSQNITNSNQDLQILELPAEEVLSYMHYGSYEQIGRSYKMLFDFAKCNNYEIILPSREVYLKGPSFFFKGDSKSFQTELQFPFRKSLTL